MPLYIYRDEQTGFEKEIHHSIKECDSPSEETLKQIIHEGRLMVRVPQAVQLAGFMNGTSTSEKTLLNAKQQQRKKRARLHTKNTLESEVKDPVAKAHLKKKYETDPYLKTLKGDHEKLK